MATIRRVSTVEHHFQLVITRVYEDGDQELLEDEDESTRLVQLYTGSSLTIPQPTRKRRSSSRKTSNSVAGKRMASPISYGAICKATSTSSTSMSRLALMLRPAHSLRPACTGPCTSASTKSARTMWATRSCKNSFGSECPCSCINENHLKYP
jgi:hypothetical protein